MRPLIKNTGETTATKIDVTLLYEGEKLTISGDERYPDLKPNEIAYPNYPFSVSATKDFTGNADIDVKIECRENNNITELSNGLQLNVEPEAWISLSKKEWNFGTVCKGSDVAYTLSIGNSGTKTMSVQKFNISHGDIYINDAGLPWTILPGEYREVEITIITEDIIGDIKRSIEVVSDGRVKDPGVGNCIVITGSVSEGIQLQTISTVTTGEHLDIDISNNIIVWTDGGDIYAANLCSGENYIICSNVSQQSKPRINGNLIAWIDGRNWDGTGYFKGDIYAYNLETKEEFVVSSDPARKTLVGVDNDKIVWYCQK